MENDRRLITAQKEFLMKTINEMKKSFQINRIKKICLSTLILTAFLLIPVLTVQSIFAENAEGPSFIENIEPVPKFDSGEINYSDAVNRKFGFKGILNAIYEDRIVVSDADIQLAHKISLSGLRKGDYVGIQYDKTGKAVAVYRLQHEYPD